MNKYVIDASTLGNIANAIRGVNGETRAYTPTEMIDAVTDIMKSITYLLVDEEGNEVTATFVEADTAVTQYAVVDSENNLCIDVITSTRFDLMDVNNSDDTFYIELPVYDLNYKSKYYIDTMWYEDPEGMIPWSSNLLDFI